MPTYDATINRIKADPLIPVEHSREIFKEVSEQSAALRMMRRLPDMGAKQLKLSVLNSLPYAYFVNGDTGLKQTTEQEWANVFITAEEIAVIVPIADSIIADAEFDLWAQVRPEVAAAFGKVIDRAIVHGTNKPSSWPTAIIPGATAVSHVLAQSSDGYADILGTGGVVALIEEDGYMVNGYIGTLPSRAVLRSIRDDNGQPLFRNGMTASEPYQLDGQRIVFPANGGVDPSEAYLIAGDWSKAVYSIRQDMTVEVFKEGVISDADGKVIYNLMQQDMTAMRFVMRLGWALPIPASMLTSGSRYPFAVYAPASSSGLTNIGAAAYSVTAPVKAAAAQTTHPAGTGYTAAIEWSPEPTGGNFDAATAFKATVTLTAETGFVFPTDFGITDVTGIPDTATAKTVTRTAPGTVVIEVTYPATAA